MESYSIIKGVWRSYFWLVFGSLALLHHLQRSLGCMEEERIGLLKLKEIFKGTKFDYGNECSTWGEQETDCCKWINVDCDLITKRVVDLSVTIDAKRGSWYLDVSLLLPFQELQNFSVYSNFFKGFNGVLNSSKLKRLRLRSEVLSEIPSIGNGTLNSLKSLDIGYNFSNFQELMKLKPLEVLDMSLNEFSGQISSIIWRMTSLKGLSLGSNKLNGSLQGLCGLRNLVELDLSQNRFSGVIPSCLGSLKSLKVLDLSYNYFVGKIPPAIFPNLKLLEYVSLSHNQLGGTFSFSSLNANSKLEVFHLQSDDYPFELSYNKNKLNVDTENPPNWVPLFQLKVLSLTNCRLNEPIGTTTSFLENQYELEYVDLSHNNLVGQVPTWLLINKTYLRFLSLKNNSLSSRLSLFPDTKNLTLQMFDVSMNQIHGELPNFFGIVLPSLCILNLSMNYLQGNIPASIGDMKFLVMLDLSNNNFSGVIPQHLAMGCVSLQVLKLSNNSLQGPLLPQMSNLTFLESLYLDNNQFSGGLSHGFSNCTRMKVLKINENLITGKIPDWLGDFSEMQSLVFSKNSLGGLIPASFCRLQNLAFLDLSWNHFHGMIPSCTNLSVVKYMHLEGNKFSGAIPHALSGLSSLITLDVRDNELVGKIPDSISSLSSLRILLLKGNNLEGLIPSQICHLKSLGILDLSSNNFTGCIPTCLYQIPFGIKSLSDGTFATQTNGWGISLGLIYGNGISIFADDVMSYSTTDLEEEIQFMSKSRSESFKGNILYYMSGVDLSHNKLTGPIPNELGNLTGIKTLNLSHNYLTGLIPPTLSNMKEIESLDLSYNKLFGHIPQELTQLNFLEVFSVAFNDLSSTIPNNQAQFETFEKSSYEGNPLLCGPPLEKSCTTHGRFPPASSTTSSTPKPENAFKDAFLWGFLVSYFAAFSGLISFLYYNGFFSSRGGPFKAKMRKYPIPN